MKLFQELVARGLVQAVSDPEIEQMLAEKGLIRGRSRYLETHVDAVLAGIPQSSEIGRIAAKSGR